MEETVSQGASRLFELGALGVIVAFFLAGLAIMGLMVMRRLIGKGKDDPGLIGWLGERFERHLTVMEEGNENVQQVTNKLTELLMEHHSSAQHACMESKQSILEIIERIKRQDIAGATAAQILRDYLKANHPEYSDALDADLQQIISTLKNHDSTA